jgi:hypothetical protein
MPSIHRLSKSTLKYCLSNWAEHIVIKDKKNTRICTRKASAALPLARRTPVSRLISIFSLDHSIKYHQMTWGKVFLVSILYLNARPVTTTPWDCPANKFGPPTSLLKTKVCCQNLSKRLLDLTSILKSTPTLSL